MKIIQNMYSIFSFCIAFKDLQVVKESVRHIDNNIDVEDEFVCWWFYCRNNDEWNHLVKELLGTFCLESAKGYHAYFIPDLCNGCQKAQPQGNLGGIYFLPNCTI